jgi:PAS domain S-box-containing protein
LKDGLPLLLAAHQLDRLSSILDAIPSEIAVVNATGQIVYTNQEWDGFARENSANQSCLSGANYLDTCRRSAQAGDPTASEVLRGLLLLLEGVEKRFDFEYPCGTPSGMKWFRMLMNAVELDGDRLVIVQHIDITERVTAEEERAASEKRLRLVLESVAEGIAVTDTAGKIVSVNAACENLFMASREVLVDTALAQHIDVPGPSAGLRLICRQEGPTQGPETISISCFPIEDRSGKLWVWTLTDVSALHRERKSHARQKGSLEQMSLNHPTKLQVGGVDGVIWSRLQENYRHLLSSAPSASIFGEAQDLSMRTDAFVEQLKQDCIAPHDFVRLHADVLHSLQFEAREARARSLSEEGRLLLLRILADLGSMYHSDLVQTR